jgi:hypothetical protein
MVQKPNFALFARIDRGSDRVPVVAVGRDFLDFRVLEGEGVLRNEEEDHF